MYRGHPISDPRLLEEATRRVNVGKKVDEYTPEFARNLAKNARLGPYLSPRALLGATQSGATPEAIELMNTGARELAQQNDPVKQGDSFWKGFLNTVGNAILNMGRTIDNISNPPPTPDERLKTGTEEAEGLLREFQRPYGVVKTVGQVAFAGAESGGSFINNYVFERRKDGSAPTAGEVLSRLGRLASLMVVPAAPSVYYQNRNDMNRAFEYTELGLLTSNWKDRGSGFFLPMDLQMEQFMSAFGLDAEGQPLPDYRGRAILGDFQSQVPGMMQQGQPVMTTQPATLGGYLWSAGWTGKRTPDGSIVETRGMNIDSGVGSFLSGATDAVVELSTDITMPVGKTIGVGAKTVKGARAISAFSEAAQEAISAGRVLGIPGTEGLKRAYVAGQFIDDIPLTTQSWTEINTLRSQFQDELAQWNARVTNGSVSAAQRDAWVTMRQSILTDAETRVWDADRLSEMIRTDERWDFMFGLIDQAKTRYANVDELAFIIRNKIFKNKISLEDAFDLAQANGKAGYREIFLEAADEIRRGQKLLPDKLSQLGATKLRRAKDALGMPFERIVKVPPVAGLAAQAGQAAARGATQQYSGQQLLTRMRNLFQLAPNDDIVVDGSVGQRMAAVDSFTSWINNLFPDDQNYVIQKIARIQKHLTEQFTDIDVVDATGNLVTKSVRAPQTRAGVRAVEEEMYDILAEYMRRNGIGKKDIQDVISRMKDEHARLRTWNMDEIGDQTDYGMLTRLRDYGLIDLDEIARDMQARTGQYVDPEDLQTISAATIQEFYNHTLVLPDWRAIKAIGSNSLTRTRDPITGELRLAPQIVDKIITTWKQTTLANLGYLARNLLDGQAALWMGDTGTASMFHKPFQFLKIVRDKAGVEDALNKPMTKEGIDNLVSRLERELSPAERNLTSISRADSWGTYKERMSATEHLVRTGDVTSVSKLDETRYPEALVQAARKIHSDPLEQLMAKVDGLPFDQKKQILMQWLVSTPEGELFQSQMLAAYQQQGVRVGLPRNMVSGLGKLTKVDFQSQTDRLAFWESLIETQIRGRVETMAQVPELRLMMVHNVVPQLSSSGRVKILNRSVGNGAAFIQTVRDIPAGLSSTMDNVSGAIYREPSSEVDYFINGVKKSPSGYEVELIELVMYNIDDTRTAPISAWSGRNGKATIEAIRVTEALGKDPSLINALPQNLPHFVEVDDANIIARKWRNLVDRIFIGTFQGAELTFEKLPAFRQFKWKEYANHYGKMSKEALLQMERNVVLGAKRLGMSPDDYMGGATRKLGRKESPYAALRQAVKDAPADKAGVTLEQVDQYAASVAEYNMRQLFYDMPKKLNFETWQGIDTLFAFLAAQRSIMQRFARLMIKNPDKPYRIGRAFNGATELDLPGDTDVGLVYRDPLTMQWKFRHPLGFAARSGLQAAGVETEGITPFVGSPIKGFSIGLTGLPGVGPVGGAVLGKLMEVVANLTDSEDKVDAFRDVFLPYEILNKDKSTLERLTPGWAVKAKDVINSIATPKKAALIQREQLDAMAALYATGKYDTSTKRGVEQLEDDSLRAAQVMVLFSVASQFLGPVAGTPDYIIETKKGDVFANAALAYYQQLKEEDFETATPRFIQTIGEDFLLYLSGKTTTVRSAKGFMLTQKYVNWARKNDFDLDYYTSGIGYYFGPADEDEFSFNARAYLMDKSLTRYKTPTEFRQSAEYAIASARYRRFRNTMPTYLNKEEQQQLAAYRAELNKQYPTYTGPSFDVNQFQVTLNDIYKIFKDEAFVDTPAIEPLKTYMRARSNLLAINGKTTFRSKAMTQARQELDAIAQRLALESPEFARMYDRVLASETDPAGIDPEIND